MSHTDHPIAKINCIIVKDFTRFGRNSIEVGYFMEMVFPLYGIRFISINDDFDSDKLHGDTGGINVAFKYLVSEFYSRDLSIKYKSAKYVKFRRGEYQSKTCPYGYRKGANGRMEPNEETAPNTDILLIHSLTRLGRDVDKVTKYWHLLRDLGVSVHTADCGEVDLSLDTMLCGMIEEIRKRPK